MDPGPFIALAFALPGMIVAGGTVWLGSRALRIWTQRRGHLYEAIDRLEAEIHELDERVDFHERLLQQQRDAGTLGRG